MNRNECISTKEFAGGLCDLLDKKLGEVYSSQIMTAQKNNGVEKEVITIRRNDTECAPSFTTERLYELYRNGTTPEDIATRISEIVLEEFDRAVPQAKEYCQKEWIQNHMYLRLLGVERNREMLENSVYVPILDLAAVFYVITDMNEDGVRSFRLPKKIWEEQDMGSVAKWYPKALQNTADFFGKTVMSMEDCLLEMFQNKSEDDREKVLDRLFEKGDEVGFQVITNRQRTYGASVILYPDFLEKEEAEFGPFYLIPSSVHEMLLLPQSHPIAVSELNSMVKQVNETQVDPEDVLAWHVYRYSGETGLVSETKEESEEVTE